jgi:hypothetical protein
LTCTEWLLPQLEEDFVKANPEWVKELQIMVTTKVKAEIQARQHCVGMMLLRVLNSRRDAAFLMYLPQ